MNREFCIGVLHFIRCCDAHILKFLRKQSLDLTDLQILGAPTSAESLSPLTFGRRTPRTGMPPPPVPPGSSF